MSRARRRLLSFHALAVAILLARAAWADGDEARRRADDSYRGAQSAFNRRDFAAAAAAFEAAASFVPHPAALLAAADAWERAGALDRAAEDCDRALALPNRAAAEQKDGVDYDRDARRCVRRLTPRLATVELLGPSTIAVRLDGGAQDVLPLTRRLKPGRHAIAVVDLKTSEQRSVELVVAAGDERRLDLGPEAAPPPPSPPRPVAIGLGAAPAPLPVRDDERLGRVRGSGGPPFGAWTAFGIGAAGAITSGVLTALLVDSRSRYEANPTRAGRDEFYRRVVWLDVALGITAASIVTGIVLWLTAPDSRTRG